MTPGDHDHDHDHDHDDEPVPDDLPLVLDASVRVLAGGRVLLGGDPGRLVRLRAAVPDLATRSSGPERRLARLLIARGLLHPRPRPLAALPDLTVVVPVRDRTDELARCLAALGRRDPVLVVDDASTDGGAVRRVCRAAGAGLLRLDVNRGPAGARNAGLAATSSPFVAFLDSDCVVGPDWLEHLVAHFADRQVAAVAPRVRARPEATLLGRYGAVRCPLDLGPAPARVRPRTRVSYVPTAALVVRRDALPAGHVFDERLRYGEDVDLVWRLHDAGWTVRYEPSVVVEHEEPAAWSAWLARRHAYGTSAAPLADRHGSRVAPLVVSSDQVLALGLLAAGRPLAAAATQLQPALQLSRALNAVGVRSREAGRVALGISLDRGLASVRGLGGAGAVVTLPVLLASLLPRRTRLLAAAGLVVPPLIEWLRQEPELDVFRWTGLRLLDDLAYASGVWRSCASERSTRAWRPVLADGRLTRLLQTGRRSLSRAGG